MSRQRQTLHRRSWPQYSCSDVSPCLPKVVAFFVAIDETETPEQSLVAQVKARAQNSLKRKGGDDGPQAAYRPRSGTGRQRRSSCRTWAIRCLYEAGAQNSVFIRAMSGLCLLVFRSSLGAPPLPRQKPGSGFDLLLRAGALEPAALAGARALVIMEAVAAPFLGAGPGERSGVFALGYYEEARVKRSAYWDLAQSRLSPPIGTMAPTAQTFDTDSVGMRCSTTSRSRRLALRPSSWSSPRP